MHFERDVLSIFETLRSQLADAMGEAAIDLARIDLAALRKGLKLHRHAQALIHDISKAPNLEWVGC